METFAIRPAQFGRFITRVSRKALATGVLLLASPAFAQMSNCVPNGPFVNCYNSDGSYTTCNRVGQTWNCPTYGGSRPSSGAEASSQGGAVAGFMGMLRSMKARRVEARVAKALRAGDCPGAVDEAFKGDDVKFALNLQAYCARQGR